MIRVRSPFPAFIHMNAFTSTYRRPRAITLGACLVASMFAAGCDTSSSADAVTASSTGEDVRCARRNNIIPRLLLECVTVAGVREHQAEFQAIADANGDTRWDGTPGFDASADYVATRLEAAGWSVSRMSVSYERLEADLVQLVPIVAPYATGAFTGTGEGDVTANVVPVDINLTPPRDPVTSGCEASDFAGFPAGAIALIQRGTCTFGDKVLNAQAAGAGAVVIFNQGNSPDREGLIVGTLGGVATTIPVVGASFADGVALAQAGSVARVRADQVTVSSENILAELAGRSENVIMAGAALDSWPDSPGINANGSGAAVLLEVAENLSHTRLDHTLRVAWWGGYAAGLQGSGQYVMGLSASELDAIALYLDFNVVGSPNYAMFVIDGDGSALPAIFPVAASATIEAFLAEFLVAGGHPSEPTQANGGSDYRGFASSGVPYSGLFTGASGIKTAQQAAIYGGTAGVAYDPCYQEACDTFANVSLDALDQVSDAVAAAILHFGTAAELPVRGGSTNAAHSSPALAAASE